MADVTILGAGIFGLSTAWACLNKGARVRVIDPAGPGAGASGGIVGALAPHVPEQWDDKKAFQLDSLLMAGAFWGDVQNASGLCPGYARNGRLQPVLDDQALELARARIITAETLWQGQAEWRVVTADGMPWGPHSPTGWLIYDTLSARLHPRRACVALAAAIEARGGEILNEGRAQGKVIHATGVAGLQTLSEQAGCEIGNGVKGQGALLDFAAPNMPQIFANWVHIIPHTDGTTAVGSTSERYYDDPVSTDQQLDEVVARAMAAVPALRGARVIERWAGLRPRAGSRAPMLGEHPFHPGQFIANGGFKIGFGMAPGVACAMADLVLDGVDQIPSGFLPRASFPKG